MPAVTQRVAKAFDCLLSEAGLDLDELYRHGREHEQLYQLAELLTEWDEFKWLDLDKMTGLMANRSVVDTRNLLDGAALRRRGFSYQGIGRS